MKVSADFNLRRCFLVLIIVLIIFFVIVFRAINFVDSKPLPSLVDVLYYNNLSLKCTNYSLRDVLMYNLTCGVGDNDSFVYFKVSADKDCLECQNNLCWGGDLLNYSATIVQVDDACLEYRIVPTPTNVNPTVTFLIS